MPKGTTAVERKSPLDYYGPLTFRALLVHATCIAVEGLLSMNEAHARAVVYDRALGLASDAMGGDSTDDKRTPYSDDDDAEDSVFTAIPVDPHVDVPASICPCFGSTWKLRVYANVALHEDDSIVFSLPWQNMNYDGCAALPELPKLQRWSSCTSLKKLLHVASQIDF